MKGSHSLRLRPRLKLALTLKLTLFFGIIIISIFSKQKNPYETLGIQKNASKSDIKKAYRKFALRCHPDKVPANQREEASEKFKLISEAYEILSDPEQKERYDRYGDVNINGSNNPDNDAQTGFSFQTNHPNGFNFHTTSAGMDGQDMNNIDLSSLFEQFLGGGGGGNLFGQGQGAPPQFGFGGHQQQQQRRTRAQKPVQRTFSCSLDELSKGCRKRLKVKHNVDDPIRMGSGDFEEKIYTIDVKPGWKSGTKINFKPQGSFPPITFVLKEKSHKYLVRKNNDLIWKCNISDSQADKALKLKLPLPDGTTVDVLTEDILPIRDGDTKLIPGKGMPIKGGPYRGDLIIEFQVKKVSRQS